MNKRVKSLLKLAELDERSSVSFAERSFSNQWQVEAAFADYKAKLLNLSEWNNHSHIMTFALYNEKGNPNNGDTVKENKLIRLSLKGTGKYDWVKIIEVYDKKSEMVVKVKPCSDPTSSDDNKAVTSHFFTAESSNNICLSKEDERIGFYVIGLNERQNTDETKNILETIRNVVTANVGSYLGIQKSEWTYFCKSFLESYNPL